MHAKETLTIPNISCGHCVSAIESELAEMDGVTSVKADAGQNRHYPMGRTGIH
jgi:copper chaperone CopZ